MIEGDALVMFERSLRRATLTGSGDTLDAALIDLGWPEALDDDPRAAISTLFHLQGHANATSSAVERVVGVALGLGGSIVLPAPGRWNPPGTVTADRLTVDGLGTGAIAGAERVFVVAAGDSSDVLVSVPTAALAVRAVRGLDPRLGLFEVRACSLDVDPSPRAVGGWQSGVRLAQLAIGHELLGAARKMLELAREHALGRVQFGRPISAFQAVRHRLADTLVSIEMADAMLDAAWLDGSDTSAAMAKALCGRAARTTAGHCQQVLAGIGFTTEHPLHLYVRRVFVLDQLLGSARSLTAELGAALDTSRRLPPLLPL